MLRETERKNKCEKKFKIKDNMSRKVNVPTGTYASVWVHDPAPSTSQSQGCRPDLARPANACNCPPDSIQRRTIDLVVNRLPVLPSSR